MHLGERAASLQWLSGRSGHAGAVTFLCSCRNELTGRNVAVTGGVDGDVRAWDAATGTQLWVVPSSTPVAALSIVRAGSPSRQVVVCVFMDATVRLLLIDPDASSHRPGLLAPTATAMGSVVAPTLRGVALAQWNLEVLRACAMTGLGNVIVTASKGTQELQTYVAALHFFLVPQHRLTWLCVTM